jgi:hypothetical protein
MSIYADGETLTMPSYTTNTFSGEVGSFMVNHAWRMKAKLKELAGNSDYAVGLLSRMASSSLGRIESKYWLYKDDSGKRMVGCYSADDMCDTFRNIVACHDQHDYRVDHRGWFTDAYCEETCHGVVAQLAGCGGNTRYIIGIDYSYDCCCFDLSYVYESFRDAVYAADRWAERVAEESVAEDVKYHQSEKLADLKLDLEKLFRRISEARASRGEHPGGMGPDECADTVRGLIEEAREIKDEIDEVSCPFWRPAL